MIKMSHIVVSWSENCWNVLFGVRWNSAVSFTELCCHCWMLLVFFFFFFFSPWTQSFISMHLHRLLLFTSLASCQCPVLGRFFSRIDHDKLNLYVLVWFWWSVTVRMHVHVISCVMCHPLSCLSKPCTLLVLPQPCLVFREQALS